VKHVDTLAHVSSDNWPNVYKCTPMTGQTYTRVLRWLVQSASLLELCCPQKQWGFSLRWSYWSNTPGGDCGVWSTWPMRWAHRRRSSHSRCENIAKICWPWSLNSYTPTLQTQDPGP